VDHFGKTENQSVQIMKYKVALQQTDEGYSVHVPGLPGCWSQGQDEAEALSNIQDAIREYLAVAISPVVRFRPPFLRPFPRPFLRLKNLKKARNRPFLRFF
jgi:predicted RNase H-like HicB family nuclease